MTYRPLGRSGLMVSAVGIGCNAFSRRVDQDGVGEILDAAQDTGVTLLDTADTYGITPGASEELIGDALLGSARRVRGRDQVRDGRPGAQRSRPRRTRLTSLHPARRGGQPATPADRPHRPLPAARPRRRDADRGDARRADRAGPRGQGALHRLLQRRRLAGRGRRLDLAHEGPGAVRLGAEPLLPARPRPRGRGGDRRASGSASAYSPSSRSSTACSPASTSAAARPPRAPAPPWTRAGPAGWRRPTGTGSRPSRRTPPSATCRILDVAIAGLAAQPTVSSVISGATRAEQVRTNAAALRWEPTEDDLIGLNAVAGD